MRGPLLTDPTGVGMPVLPGIGLPGMIPGNPFDPLGYLRPPIPGIPVSYSPPSLHHTDCIVLILYVRMCTPTAGIPPWIGPAETSPARDDGGSRGQQSHCSTRQPCVLLQAAMGRLVSSAYGPIHTPFGQAYIQR